MSANIWDMHGGTVVAMKAKECVAIATDLRLGENKMKTIALNVSKVHQISDKLFVGLTGFNTDCIALADKLKVHHSLYEMREHRPMTPKVLNAVMTNMLYKKRFGNYFLTPVIAGLHPTTNESFISVSDCIGSATCPEDFVVVGTGEEYALSVCETFWRPDLTPDQLTEATAQVMLSVIERDASTGWGALVYTIKPDGVTCREVKTRMD